MVPGPRELLFEADFELRAWLIRTALYQMDNSLDLDYDKLKAMERFIKTGNEKEVIL